MWIAWRKRLEFFVTKNSISGQISVKVAGNPHICSCSPVFHDQWLKRYLFTHWWKQLLMLGFCSRLSSEHSMLHLWTHQPFQSTSVQQQGPNSITKFGSWKDTFSASILSFVIWVWRELLKRLLFSAGIFKESVGARNRIGIGLSYLPARQHRLTELIPWNRFLGSLKV
jgi:hypothetical protein